MADVHIGLEAFYDSLNISGEAVTFGATAGGDIHESRPFNATVVRKNGGLANYSGTASGVMTSADPAKTMFDDVLSSLPFSIFFDIGTFGAVAAEDDLALFGNPVMAGPQWTNTNGNLAEWTMPMEFKPLVLGFVGARGTKTVSGNGTGHQFTGGIADGQSLYAVVHCPVATSGTIDIIVESDTGSGFPGATTRITFAQIATTPTAQLLTWKPAGGHGDDWYRFAWTSATTPSHNIACAFGIM